MPLWKIYHPANTWSGPEKQALAERITALYRQLPKFYVGVVFQEVDAQCFYIGGEPRENFVRIWVDHIARTLPTPEIRAKWLDMCNEALAPFVRDRGLSWEFHIDETSPELWSIEGLRPPAANSELEARWIRENRPSAES
jgi:phenylpyruvate tautomerase PptA (4-oxalocrotonate tautomerase family)